MTGNFEEWLERPAEWRELEERAAQMQQAINEAARCLRVAWKGKDWEFVKTAGVLLAKLETKQ